MKISACLIVKNESNNIKRCLDSLLNVADEIIVVDTGSIDDTVSIAHSYGATVYNYEWDNNFANAKNYALDKARGDWIIFLDADEYFDKNIQTVLREILKQIYPKKKYDSIVSRMIHTDGYGGRVISENLTIRIFRKSPLIRFVGGIHERPLNNGKSLESTVINNYDLIIYHTGYAASGLKEKFRRNLILLEEQEKSNHIDHMTYYYLSASYSNLENDELAIKYALLALQEPKLKKTGVAYKPYVFLFIAMLALKDRYGMDKIGQCVEDALGLYPKHPEIWRLKAIYQTEKKEYKEALDSYRQAISFQQSFDHKISNDFPMFMDEAYNNMGAISKLLDDVPNALEYYYQAAKINKYNKKTLIGLLDIIKDQNTEEIVFFLNSIYNKSDEKDVAFLASSLSEINIRAAVYYQNLRNTQFV